MTVSNHCTMQVQLHGLQRQCGAQVTQDFIAKRFVNGARRAARGLCEGAEAFDDLAAVASGERAQLCMQTANPFWITLAGIAVMDAVDLEVRQAGDRKSTRLNSSH